MRTSAEIPSPGYSHCIISIDNVGFRQSRGDSVRKKHDVFFQIQSEVTAQEQPSYAQTDQVFVYILHRFAFLSLFFPARQSLSVFNKRLWRFGEIDPIEPAMLLRGNTARKPSRINDSDNKPLDAKSSSEGEIISSKPLTYRCNCVLTPQTSKSRQGGGNSRKIIAGRFLILPSACGIGVRTTSPSFIFWVGCFDHVQ